MARKNINRLNDTLSRFFTDEFKTRNGITVADLNVLAAFVVFEMVNNNDDGWTYPFSTANNKWHRRYSFVLACYGLKATSGSIVNSFNKLSEYGILQVEKSKCKDGKYIPYRVKTIALGGIFSDNENVISLISEQCNDLAAFLGYLVTEKEINEQIDMEYRNMEREAQIKSNIRASISKTKIEHNNQWIADTRRKLIENATKSECLVRNMFIDWNMRYCFQYPFMTNEGHVYFTDFYLPEFGIAIEIDGEYHDDIDQQIKDLKRTKEIESLGVRVYRLNNVDTYNYDILADSVNNIISRRRNEINYAQN